MIHSDRSKVYFQKHRPESRHIASRRVGRLLGDATQAGVAGLLFALHPVSHATTLASRCTFPPRSRPARRQPRCAGSLRSGELGGGPCRRPLRPARRRGVPAPRSGRPGSMAGASGTPRHGTSFPPRSAPMPAAGKRCCRVVHLPLPAAGKRRGGVRACPG